MTKTEILSKVKTGLGGVPSQLDETINLYIDEVIAYLLSAGVSTTLLDLENDLIDERCVGVIIRGVADLWNYGNSDTKFSEYFYQRADQLRGVINE
jgi:hypothetical protein